MRKRMHLATLCIRTEALYITYALSRYFKLLNVSVKLGPWSIVQVSLCISEWFSCAQICEAGQQDLIFIYF